MRWGLLLSLAMILWGILGCEEKAEYIPSKPQVIRMPSTTQEVPLPSRLWEQLELVYRPMIFDKTTAEEGHDSKAKLESPKEFFSFHVYLKEKSSGILQNHNGYDLTFGASGGFLDLQEFLNFKKGSFVFGFRPDLELKPDDVMKVYYLSNARTIKIDGETHGAGCDKYLDITDYFRKKMNKEGILVNTTEGRHAVLMTGTYFFATSLKGKLYLSQLTVKDSRFKKLACSFK